MRRRPRAGAPRAFEARPVVGSRLEDPPERLAHPMFEFDDRLAALERAFYRHLLEQIDLDGVFLLEHDLWSQLEELGPLDDDLVLDLANAIIARAFERVGHDPARAMKPGVIGPDGEVVDAPPAPHGDCPFCAPPAPSAPGPRGTGPGAPAGPPRAQPAGAGPGSRGAPHAAPSAEAHRRPHREAP